MRNDPCHPWHYGEESCFLLYTIIAVCILGQVQSSRLLVRFSICPKKRAKWIEQIRTALETGRLDAGGASKLAGRLNFANQHLFRRLGRAMIRAIYAQTCSATGKIGARLREALEWWLRTLMLDITECCPFDQQHEGSICKLFVDAASTPPQCAAALCVDGDVVYTNAAPSYNMISQLMARRDKQITSLVRIDVIRSCAPLCRSFKCARRF